jgi:hypothetical protein
LEGRDKVDVSTIINSQGEGFKVLGVLNETYRFAPRDGSTCNLYCSFESVLYVVTNLVAHGGQESMLRLNWL